MVALNFAIPKEAWIRESGQRNGAVLPAVAIDSWESSLQKVAEFQQLGDDWDGLGAIAPSQELVLSALALAHLLQERGVPAPSRVVAGLDGVIAFEWQLPDGTYADVEIVRPFFAEVMLLEPGKPAKHWNLPTA